MMLTNNMIRYLMFILGYILVETLSGCRKSEFFAINGFTIKNITIIQTEHSATVEQCHRMCRLYTECEAFNMGWADLTQTRGRCEILRTSTRKGHVENSSSSIYSKLLFNQINKCFACFVLSCI